MSCTTAWKGTIGSKLQELAKEDPEKPAFVFYDACLNRTVLTRHDVWDKSRKCAAFLRGQGVGKNDLVCNTLPNSKERLITMYGTILAGAVTMQGQKLLAGGDDIVKNWKESRCKAVIVKPGEQSGVSDVLDKLRYVGSKTGQDCYKGLPFLTLVIPVTVGETFMEILEEKQESYVDEEVTEDDVAMIWCTSGSTGFSKLVPQTHRRALIIANYLKANIGLNTDSVYFSQRSMGWVGGAPTLYPIVGFTRVLVDWALGDTEDPGAFNASVIEHEKCDRASMMPSTIQAVLDHLDSVGKRELGCRPLRCIGTGGGPVSKNTMKALDRITESITVMYGSSEFGVTHGINIKNESEYNNACCGFPKDPDAVETKIVDHDLQEVPRGTTGEVLFRGPSLLTGYLNNPNAGRQVFLDGGWFRTSDIGHMDDMGQLFVYCRKSFVMNYRGYKHYPGWMETNIDKHPDIKKSMVVGIPDPADYERICVCIIRVKGSSLTAEQAQEYCKAVFKIVPGQNTDATPMPRYFLFFDSFPLNANGKLDRMALKELALRRVKVEYNNNEQSK